MKPKIISLASVNGDWRVQHRNGLKQFAVVAWGLSEEPNVMLPFVAIEGKVELLPPEDVATITPGKPNT